MPYLTNIRHNFLLPIATGRMVAVINAIPNLEYWDPVENEAPSFQPELRYTKNGNLIRFYFTKRISSINIPHLGVSAGINGKWDVYQVMPKGIYPLDGPPRLPKNLGTRAMNKLGRFILNNSDDNANAQGKPYIGLPMTFKEVEERYPSAANKYLKPQRSVLDGNGDPTNKTESVPGSNVQLNPTTGEDPEIAASIDWRPTNDNLQNDDEAPDDVWPWVDDKVIEEKAIEKEVLKLK